MRGAYELIKLSSGKKGKERRHVDMVERGLGLRVLMAFVGMNVVGDSRREGIVDSGG